MASSGEDSFLFHLIDFYIVLNILETDISNHAMTKTHSYN